MLGFGSFATDEATGIPAIMLFDNCYAANMVTGR